MTHGLHQRLEHHAAELGDQPITLGALAQAHGSALPGSLLVLVSAPCALPIPGVGNVLGVTMMVMALAMWRGEDWAVLPSRVARLEISARAARWVLLLLAHVYRLAGRWSRERLCRLTVLQRRTWVAPMLALMGVVIFLPLPLGNVLPSLAIVVLGVGMTFRDGLAVVSAVGMALMSVAYAAAMAAGTWAWIIEPLVTWSRLAA
ncbi:MAG: exopolysaccharide biosynthesis protein [Burkholderiales bacterium]|nr:exopolysaccharide biosynthesis protein [Burkholderiales bacterium]